MSVYLAVDAGDTRTECMSADKTRVLARLAGPPVVRAPGMLSTSLTDGSFGRDDNRSYGFVESIGCQSRFPEGMTTRRAANKDGRGALLIRRSGHQARGLAVTSGT